MIKVAAKIPLQEIFHWGQKTKPILKFNNSPPCMTTKWREGHCPFFNFLERYGSRMPPKLTMYQNLRGYCPLTKNCDVLCSISKSPSLFWNITYASYSELSRELKTGIKIYVGQAVPDFKIDQNIILVLIHNLKPASDQLKFNDIFSSFDNLLEDACIIFLKKWWLFWDSPQNMLILQLGVQHPLNH